MAQAHTGHLTGSDAVTSAVFRQFGVTRVDGLDELLETAAMFARTPARRAGRRRVRLLHLRRHRRPHGRPGRRRRAAAPAARRAPPQRALHDGYPGLPAGLEPGRQRRRARRPTGGAARSSTRSSPTRNVDALDLPDHRGARRSTSRSSHDLVDVAETTDKPICVVWGSPAGTDDTCVPRAARRRAARVPHVRQLRDGGAGVPRLPRLPVALPLAVRRRTARGPARGAQGAAHARGSRARRRALRARVEAGARRVRHPGHRRTCCARARRPR